NQDSVLVLSTSYQDSMAAPKERHFYLSNAAVFMVADGLGSHGNGALASRTVAQSMARWTLDVSNIDGVRRSLDQTNHEIYSLIKSRHDPSPMGSTCAGLAIL